MSVQGVLNTGLSKKAGLFEANAFVQGTAFIISAVIMLAFGKGSVKEIFSVSPVYLTGGLIGVLITVTVMLGIKNLSPTVAISTILISQLAVAALIDALGILGADKKPFGFNEIAGLVLMICGVVIFKIKG